MKNVNITANSANGFKVEIQSKTHNIIVDQPKQMGGNDEGASPLDFLLAALGSCLITVGLIVAKQERLPLQAIRVSVSGEYDPEVLMGKNNESRSGFHSIQAEVEVDAPDMSAEDKAAFVAKVENRCPVTDNLRSQTPVIVVAK